MVNQSKPRVSIDKLPPEQARGNFHLLLLANPNYFGNLGESEFKPVLSISGDTAYEELGCVGFSPSLSRLEAVVAIKQDSGYGGGLCSAGSQEYVRFYLSLDDGATWQDQGAAGFTSHDLPGPKPLEYSVSHHISVPEEFCFVENLPRVRAILSWNYEPPAHTPDFVPVWGNVVNVTIQIPGFKFVMLNELLAKAKAQLPPKMKLAVNLEQAIPVAPEVALSVAEIAAAYKEKPVPPKRFLYPEIEKFSGSQGLSLTLKAVTNLGDIIAEIISTSGDTTYEELDCVGLDINRSALAGVVKVKLPYGFNGGPCTAGSTEYVAFWVDWGSGYEYAGTTMFQTHDISAIPPEGIEYAVVLPVDVASHMQPCAMGAKTANVRAILSWQTSPPPTDPNYVPAWGNPLNALIQIPSGTPFVTDTPDIAIIGGIGVAQIDTTISGMTNPGAVFALTGTVADPWNSTRQCPFGGQIVIQGLPTVGRKYRVKVQKVGSPLPVVLTDSITTTDWMGNPTTRHPDSSGFFTYLDITQNIDNILAYWYSSGDDQWYVWLELADMSDNVLSQTTLYLIQLDNTAPTASIHIDSGGDCKQFDAGPINGHFVAQDIHFGVFSLQTLPSTMTPSPNPPTTATPPTSQTAASPGDGWQLSTTTPNAMAPCGYVVQLQVWDNSIVGSGPGGHNYNHAEVGFCLKAGS
ncbi:MAG: hypothetical protein VST70_00760 [Nitrospirota bacterium]|nr:hypothetical protein [Nitrospirota bacterium]